MSKLYLGTIPINKVILNLVDVRKFYLNGVEINIGPIEPSTGLIELTEDMKGLILKQGLSYPEFDISTGTTSTSTLQSDITISNILQPQFDDNNIRYNPEIEQYNYPKENARISNVYTDPPGSNVTPDNLLKTFQSSPVRTDMYLGGSDSSQNFLFKFDTTITNLNIGGHLDFDDYLDMYYWYNGSLTACEWTYSIETTITDSNGKVYTMETANGTRTSREECQLYYNTPKWTITTDTCTIHRELRIAVSGSFRYNNKIELRRAKFAVQQYYVDYSVPYYLNINSMKFPDGSSDTTIQCHPGDYGDDLASFNIKEADNTIYNLTIL